MGRETAVLGSVFEERFKSVEIYFRQYRCSLQNPKFTDHVVASRQASRIGM